MSLLYHVMMHMQMCIMQHGKLGFSIISIEAGPDLEASLTFKL
jgi:hypothetical protein